MRRILAVLAVCAAALIPAAVTAPALASPGGSHIGLNELFTSKNVATGLFLHAHCGTCEITVQSGGVQQWITQDAQTWLDTTTGQFVTTIEIALNGGTGGCIGWDGGLNEFALFLCDSGFADGSQQFYVPNNGTGDQFINADATAHVPGHAHNIYATVNQSNDTVVPAGPGFGNFAVWAETCFNC